MNPVEILTHVRTQPFEPFRLHVSDGSHYDVPHPEFIYVMRNAVMVTVRSDSEEVTEKAIRIDPIHITRLEPMQTHKAG
jgi:hypothetical protein